MLAVSRIKRISWWYSVNREVKLNKNVTHRKVALYMDHAFWTLSALDQTELLFFFCSRNAVKEQRLAVIIIQQETVA